MCCFIITPPPFTPTWQVAKPNLQFQFCQHQRLPVTRLYPQVRGMNVKSKEPGLSLSAILATYLC